MPVESNHTPCGAHRVAIGRPATQASSSSSGRRRSRTPAASMLSVFHVADNGVIDVADDLDVRGLACAGISWLPTASSAPQEASGASESSRQGRVGGSPRTRLWRSMSAKCLLTSP